MKVSKSAELQLLAHPCPNSMTLSMLTSWSLGFFTFQKIEAGIPILQHNVRNQ